MSSFYLCEIWMLHMASFYSWKRNKMLRMGGFYPYIFISTKKCDVTNVWFDLWIVHTDIAQCMLQNMMFATMLQVGDVAHVHFFWHFEVGWM
mgnify:CR=1 FL=1